MIIILVYYRTNNLKVNEEMMPLTFRLTVGSYPAPHNLSQCVLVRPLIYIKFITKIRVRGVFKKFVYTIHVPGVGVRQ